MSGEVEERIAALERQDAELGSEVRRLTERMDQRGQILDRLASQISEIHRALFEGDERGGIRSRLANVENKADRVSEIARRMDIVEARLAIASKLTWLLVAGAIGVIFWLLRGG